jgi:hypothetical protein
VKVGKYAVVTVDTMKVYRESGGTNLLVSNLRGRLTEWSVSYKTRPVNSKERRNCSLKWESGWAPGSAWTVGINVLQLLENQT